MIKNVIPLNNTVFFPNMIISFDVTHISFIETVNEAVENEETILLITLKNNNGLPIDIKDVYTVGVLCKIIRTIRINDNTVRVFAETKEKCKVIQYTFSKSKITCDAIYLENNLEEVDNIEVIATFKAVKDYFLTYSIAIGLNFPDLTSEVKNSDNVVKVCDIIAHAININFTTKQIILEMTNIRNKLDLLLKILINETDIAHIKNSIVQKAKENIEKNQRNYFLREQIKVINNELGETTSIEDEALNYKKLLEEKNLPEVARVKIENEINRLKRTISSPAENSVIRDYLDRVLELPWNENEKTEEIKNLVKAEKILNDDHFGLEKVKERILEFLAVRQHAPNSNSPILCFVGPPGVGKTSVAMSIAKATGRKYNRIALGGINDEADIRGHRKTYIGAMPGKIITALSQTKVNNPLILFDEIDKMGKDIKGDPSSALLEVLDSAQNSKFSDHYIGLDFDLSKVLFICTANSLSGIPEALKDRLEIIELSSYSKEEKEIIGKKYLLPKQMKLHNIDKSMLNIRDEVFCEIIKFYTKEAGVRNLERELGKICRKIVTEKLKTEKKKFIVTLKNLPDYLGRRKFINNIKNEKCEIGIVRGLAYTSIGGTTLSIEANCLDGSGKTEFTGNLGKIMEESAKVALSYIRSEEKNLGLSNGFYKKIDLSIHIPEGATPKDGPSAGVALATSIISALTGKYVKHDIGMTGEITIRGKVLPIGGLKEKILAGKSAGLRKIFIPFENKPDYHDLDDYIKKDIEIVFVKQIDEILNDVLLEKEEAESYECK